MKPEIRLIGLLASQYHTRLDIHLLLHDHLRERYHLNKEGKLALLVLKALGVEPASALMVGDGLLDMEVGKSVGLKCVGVLTGSNTLDQLEAAGADIVLPSALSLVVSE